MENQNKIDSNLAKHYWTFDLVAEKSIRYFRIIANIEHLPDIRQSKFGLYAPLAGRIANLEIKFRL